MNREFIKTRIQNAVCGGKIYVKNGLPMIDIPLPSRRENCQFVLRPMSDTVGSLSEALVNEDSGIEVVTFYTSGQPLPFIIQFDFKFYPDGSRISKSTHVQHLLTFPMFYLRINDAYYEFGLDASFNVLSSDKLATLSEFQSKVIKMLIRKNFSLIFRSRHFIQC